MQAALRNRRGESEGQRDEELILHKVFAEHNFRYCFFFVRFLWTIQ